ncbi:MAG: hypothetical protein COU11_00320 [Candidatus Harrisonbacteria bacterium CG10_big_fil_rev_8_21_14_0_10_49_15]|uniref:Uncharacterized protein n=1 Tax=Candidatus Harrisonbacteria bacterium CG10_big_fil_rev_8_21_14_0_10_49_15 TaxID=1974587 RepID=A0A2H0UM37_9BACT|nr:MAG: hypothetical protein COU11_00320 [Candidatus Harrisonbacteria bacterium CG10_big_fil_rev_8_21_14_0_10_49_15]
MIELKRMNRFIVILATLAILILVVLLASGWPARFVSSPDGQIESTADTFDDSVEFETAPALIY